MMAECKNYIGCLPLPAKGWTTCCLYVDLLKPGEKEEDINTEIFELTAARFGTRKHWHKRLVRTGENTIHPIFVDTPDRVLQDDDIAFIDLGPVFGNLEADFARTYVIGKPFHRRNCAAAAGLVLSQNDLSSLLQVFGSGFSTHLFTAQSARAAFCRGRLLSRDHIGCRG